MKDHFSPIPVFAFQKITESASILVEEEEEKKRKIYKMIAFVLTKITFMQKMWRPRQFPGSEDRSPDLIDQGVIEHVDKIDAQAIW